MLRLRLSCVVSAGTLKTGRLLSVVRLPWAQEVSGSNPDASTNLFCDLQASLKSPSPHYGGNSGDSIATSPAFPLPAAFSPLLLASSPHDTSLAFLLLQLCNALRFSRTALSSRFPNAPVSS